MELLIATDKENAVTDFRFDQGQQIIVSLELHAGSFLASYVDFISAGRIDGIERFHIAGFALAIAAARDAAFELASADGDTAGNQEED